MFTYEKKYILCDNTFFISSINVIMKKIYMLSAFLGGGKEVS